MNPASVDSIITRLRPRDVGGIIDQAFRLYRKHFLTFLAIIAVIYVPTELVVQGVALPFLVSSGSLSNPSGFDSSSSSRLNQTLTLLAVLGGAVLLFSLLAAVLQYISQGALTASVADSYLDKPVTFGNAYREVRPRITSLLGYMGLIVLIVVGAVLLLLVPFFALTLANNSGGAAALFGCLLFLLMFPALILTIYITTRLQLVVPSIVVEGLGPVQAMRRSWGLVNNYWWRTLGVTILLGILSTIIAAGPAYVFVGLAQLVFSLDPLINQAITSFITVLTGMFFVPLQLIAMTLYYFDLRVRKEGFDLDAAMRQAYPYGYGYGQGQGPVGGGQWAGTGGQPQPTQPNPMYPPALGYGQQQAPQAQQGQPTGYNYGYTPPPTQPAPQQNPRETTDDGRRTTDDQNPSTFNLQPSTPTPVEPTAQESATPYGNDPLGLYTPDEPPTPEPPPDKKEPSE